VIAMRRLYLLRHAKSSWDDPTLPDHDRPLAPRGRKACGLLRDHLAAEAILPEVVICSSATRTQETLAAVIDGFANEPSVWEEERLYGAGADEMLGVIHELSGEFNSAMLVGHNPGTQQLAELLARDTDGSEALLDLRRKYPTGAFATLSFDGEWLRLGPGVAVLEAFVRPADLR